MKVLLVDGAGYCSLVGAIDQEGFDHHSGRAHARGTAPAIWREHACPRVELRWTRRTPVRRSSVGGRNDDQGLCICTG